MKLLGFLVQLVLVILIFVMKQILLIIQEDVTVENLNEMIYELYNQELSDLMIGYNFNQERISKIIDMIAAATCHLPHIAELNANKE